MKVITAGALGGMAFKAVQTPNNFEAAGALLGTVVFGMAIIGLIHLVDDGRGIF